MNECVVSSLAVSCEAPAPLIESAASKPAVTDTASAPVSEYVAPSPAASYAADISRMNEELAAALAEAEAAQCEMLEADTTLADLPPT